MKAVARYTATAAQNAAVLAAWVKPAAKPGRSQEHAAAISRGARALRLATQEVIDSGRTMRAAQLLPGGQSIGEVLSAAGLLG